MARNTYPGTLRRPGKTFWWRGIINGHRYHRTFKTTDAVPVRSRLHRHGGAAELRSPLAPVGSVDLRRGMVRVVSSRDGHRTKTGRSRTLSLTPRLAIALRAHAARYRFGGGLPRVFHHTAGDQNATAGDRINDLAARVRRGHEASAPARRRLAVRPPAYADHPLGESGAQPGARSKGGGARVNADDVDLRPPRRQRPARARRRRPPTKARDRLKPCPRLP